MKIGFYVKFDSLRRQWQQRRRRRLWRQWQRRRKQHSAHMYGIFKGISIDSIMLVAHSDAKQRNNSHEASLTTTTTITTIRITTASKSNRVKTWRKNFYSLSQSVLSHPRAFLFSLSPSPSPMHSLFLCLSCLHSLWFVFFLLHLLSCLVYLFFCLLLILLAVRLRILLFYLSGRKSEQREMGTHRVKEWKSGKKGKESRIKGKVVVKMAAV